MKTRDLLRLVLSNLRRMKARVAMTAIGVIIGTAAVVVLVSLGAGLQKQATANLYNMGGLDELMVRIGYMEAPAATGGSAGQAASPPALDAAKIEEIRGMEGVIAATPLLDIYMQGPLRLNRQDGWAQMYGVEMEDFARIAALDRGTLELYRGQIVIGSMVPANFIPWEAFQEAEQAGLEPPEPPELLNQTLQMVKFTYDPVTYMQSESIVARLQVVGVLKKQGYLYDYSVFLPLKEALRLNQRLMEGQPGVSNPDKDGYAQVLVKVSHPSLAPAVEQTLKDQGFSVESARTQIESLNNFFAIVQAILGGIGAVALLVAAFGIANTMTMAIYERTREIGLMKAIGATNQDVMSVFLAEAGSIGLLGGIGGVGLAMALNTVINVVGQSLLAESGGILGGMSGETATTLTAMPLWLPIFAVIFAILIGVASGIYPAIRAAALSPIQALKYE
ncbi:MAG TPA: ABC transporter permease [Anaerolineae bacterium]|nr:ABC transporter permease [Anaerolineae bacterium]HOS79306.1 ABC transporter permease [Anaerolineae bacterium]HQJ10876.1 ABC transporter permease [Anaerolineae bacterium]HQM13471.1 ABC transporter permease [Anaerolineae bacterium]